jgi:hypothetical protein
MNLLLFLILFFLSALEITAETTIALLPFSCKDITQDYAAKLSEYIPRYILNHSLNDSISSVPFDTILQILDQNSIPRYEALSLEQLKKLSNVLNTHVLVVCTIDSFKMHSTLNPQKQPTVQVGVEITVAYYNSIYKIYCLNEDRLVAGAYRTVKTNKNKPGQKFLRPNESAPPALIQEAFTEILAHLTQQFYSKATQMLGQIDRDKIYQNKIKAGDQSYIIDVQGRNAFVYLNSGFEQYSFRNYSKAFRVYGRSKNGEVIETGRINIFKHLKNGFCVAYIIQGVKTIAPRQRISILE